jgi:hypothetical protein
MRVTIKLARLWVGHKSGLGNPSKMPGRSTGIPAAMCKQGAKLAKIPGSVCSDCYATKGNYQFPDVVKGHRARFEALMGPMWVEGMTFLITRRETDGWFRWHDSGDIQSGEHLERIMDVCEATPTTRHWLPTKEVLMVKRVLSIRECPPNLNIRVSSFMRGAAPMRRLPAGVTTSTVEWSDAPATCPAPQQDNACGDCRRCWDPAAPNTNYKRH